MYAQTSLDCGNLYLKLQQNFHDLIKNLRWKQFAYVLTVMLLEQIYFSFSGGASKHVVAGKRKQTQCICKFCKQMLLLHKTQVEFAGKCRRTRASKLRIAEETQSLFAFLFSFALLESSSSSSFRSINPSNVTFHM